MVWLPREEYWRTRAARKVAQKLRRSIVGKIPIERLDTIANIYERALRWILPWDENRYPGIIRGSTELTGMSYAMVKKMRDGSRRVSPKVAKRVADVLQARVDAALPIIAELRAIEAADKVKRAPRGWQVVKERDGIVRDGRGRGARAA